MFIKWINGMEDSSWFPHINRDMCTDCGDCINACPTNALGQRDGKSSLIHPQLCIYCADCETKAGQLDRVEWTLQFSGTLTETQRARLLEIAQMCPVHRTLRSEIHIPAPAIVEDESRNG